MIPLTAQQLASLNTFLASFGFTPVSAQTAPAPPEPISTVTGAVIVAEGPNGVASVTVYPSNSFPVSLTVNGTELLTGIVPGSIHTITYYPAAAQAAVGVVNANDKLIAVQ